MGVSSMEGRGQNEPLGGLLTPICMLSLSQRRSTLISSRIQPASQCCIPHGGWAWLGCLVKNRLVFVPVGLGVLLGMGDPGWVQLWDFFFLTYRNCIFHLWPWESKPKKGV